MIEGEAPAGAATPPPRLLIVAGNDPGGGAGLCADIQTATCFAVHPMPVVTSVTVQDTVDVSRVDAVDAALVREQIDAVVQDMGVQAVKIGLLVSETLADTVARAIAPLARAGVPIVLDPVLKAGGGGRLGESPLARALRERLLPLATVATPNRFELTELVATVGEGGDARVAAGSAREAARALAAQSGCRLLVTGADVASDDGADEVENFCAFPDGRVRSWRWPRLDGRYHGSGCTMAAALASALALGDPPEAAMTRAQQFTHEALARGFRPGRGQAVPWRMLK